MVKAEDVELNELRNVIKSLNSSDLVENKIKVIGKKKEDLLALFAETVEGVPDESANDLPADVILFYNNVFNEDEEESKEEEPKKDVPKTKAPAPKAEKKTELAPKEEKKTEPAPKAEKPVKEKKERKLPAPRTFEKDEFGYVIGTGANLIDRAIIDAGSCGVTKEEMEKASGRSANSHLYTLIKLKNIPIVKRDGKYFYEPKESKPKSPKAPAPKKPSPKGKK